MSGALRSGMRWILLAALLLASIPPNPPRSGVIEKPLQGPEKPTIYQLPKGHPPVVI